MIETSTSTSTNNFTRRCHSHLLLRTLKQTIWYEKSGKLRLQTDDATYTRPPKQQSYNYDALGTLRKQGTASRPNMFRADSAIIVAYVFGASISKLTSKILFSSANTNFVFFASSWSQRRVSMNYSQPTQAATITLFHLSALRHLSREIHSDHLFIYVYQRPKQQRRLSMKTSEIMRQGHPHS